MLLKNIPSTENVFGSIEQENDNKEVLKTHTYLLKKQTMFKMKDVEIPSAVESAQSFISQNLIKEEAKQEEIKIGRP